MKKISVYQIDAFTKKPFHGNPAGVVKNNNLSDDEMQKIAAEMNLSETAFITDSDKADYRLRWFTPAMEVDLCGHATVASLHFLYETGELKDKTKVTFETRSGILTCFADDGLYYMQIPSLNCSHYPGSRSEVLSAVSISEEETEGNFILLENGYLYVYLKTLKVMGNLKPDMQAVKNLSAKGVKSIVVFTTETNDKNNHGHSRFFGPYFGINEDPVTGSANGPLLMVMKTAGKLSDVKEAVFEQGDFIGRPGRVKVMEKDDSTYIAGNAVTVLKGEICF
jgi:trans-2,3-dihydro-3-hydroxyanthranilate isomerase